MNINTTVLIALITAIAAILAPLISKYIECKYQLKLKGIEILLSRKIQAYQDFTTEASKYVYITSGRDGPEYAKYLETFHKALIVSNPETTKSLEDFEDVMNKLRGTNDPILRSIMVSGKWYDSFYKVVDKMRLDVHDLYPTGREAQYRECSDTEPHNHQEHQKS